MTKHIRPIRENFRGTLDPALSPLEIGTGHIERGDGIRFIIEKASTGQYSDAQLYNYRGLKRVDFPDSPPLRMTVRAWASHSATQLIGTAGFGFWNQPVMPGQTWPRLPRNVWFFFGSPPSNMAFAQGVPGYGWKAAVLDTSRLPFLLLAPTAPLGFLLMRNPALYHRLWPIGQWAMGASEILLDVELREPHTYRLDWLSESVSFFVDDRMILKTPYAPHGPLGFVAWLDNQYAVVTPQGHIKMGLVPVLERQWLALDQLSIEPL